MYKELKVGSKVEYSNKQYIVESVIPCPRHYKCLRYRGHGTGTRSNQNIRFCNNSINSGVVNIVRTSIKLK